MSGIAILGSTGSIGASTLDVVAQHRHRFEVVALAARTNVAVMTAQCLQWRPRYAAMMDTAAAGQLETRLRECGCRTEVLAGPAALDALAADAAAPVVMAAISGAAGLGSTLAAARAGKRLLLANKESVVMAGAALMAAVHASGATLIPIDSEHNAIFQCLPAGWHAGTAHAGVRRLLLTASGGPFLRWTAAAMDQATPEQACAHPRWNMGAKISVDSATLVNKGLELIEASVLFGMSPQQIDIVVHPQSVLHSMVEYLDGSVLAQLSSPDMRTPIAQALAWPARISAGVEWLDLIKVAKLEFEAPDLTRFPALGLARAAAVSGGLAPTWLNAADEVAVQAFLDKRLNFGDIPGVIAGTMERFGGGNSSDLATILAADSEARDIARAALKRARHLPAGARA